MFDLPVHLTLKLHVLSIISQISNLRFSLESIASRVTTTEQNGSMSQCYIRQLI